MARPIGTIRITLLAGSMVVAAIPTRAAEVTSERLVNADREPQNWLMNHRTYNGQRFSPLARINKGNVKNLRLAYPVPLDGGSGNEFIQATPLAEDGFLYITNSWGVLYKIDGTSGDVGRIVWRMDPKQQRQGRNRGAALWGNLVITAAEDHEDDRHRMRNPARSSGMADPGHAEVALRSTSPSRRGSPRRGERGSRRARLDGWARCRNRQAAVAEVHDPGTGRARQ